MVELLFKLTPMISSTIHSDNNNSKRKVRKIHKIIIKILAYNDFVEDDFHDSPDLARGLNKKIHRTVKYVSPVSTASSLRLEMEEKWSLTNKMLKTQSCVM